MNKPILADSLWSNFGDLQHDPYYEYHYVLEGGALLHRIPWPKWKTYDEICDTYVEYVLPKYGRATVVFDGYLDEPSTKDATHERRTGQKAVYQTDQFFANMICNLKKEEILHNNKNKQRFIDLLGKKLRSALFSWWCRLFNRSNCH